MNTHRFRPSRTRAVVVIAAAGLLSSCLHDDYRGWQDQQKAKRQHDEAVRNYLAAKRPLDAVESTEPTVAAFADLRHQLEVGQWSADHELQQINSYRLGHSWISGLTYQVDATTKLDETKLIAELTDMRDRSAQLHDDMAVRLWGVMFVAPYNEAVRELATAVKPVGPSYHELSVAIAMAERVPGKVAAALQDAARHKPQGPLTSAYTFRLVDGKQLDSVHLEAALAKVGEQAREVVKILNSQARAAFQHDMPWASATQLDKLEHYGPPVMMTTPAGKHVKAGPTAPCWEWVAEGVDLILCWSKTGAVAQTIRKPIPKTETAHASSHRDTDDSATPAAASDERPAARAEEPAEPTTVDVDFEGGASCQVEFDNPDGTFLAHPGESVPPGSLLKVCPPNRPCRVIYTVTKSPKQNVKLPADC